MRKTRFRLAHRSDRPAVARLLLAALDSLQDDMEQLQRAYEISFEGEGERSPRKVYLSERVEHDLDALEIAEELMASIGT